MARVFFVVVAVSVALAAVMAIPFPQEGGDGEAPAPPSEGGDSATQPPNPGGFNYQDCQRYEQQCKDNQNQLNTTQNNPANPIQNNTQAQQMNQQAFCNQPGLQQYCKQMQQVPINQNNTQINAQQINQIQSGLNNGTNQQQISQIQQNIQQGQNVMTPPPQG